MRDAIIQKLKEEKELEEAKRQQFETNATQQQESKPEDELQINNQ